MKSSSLQRRRRPVLPAASLIGLMALAACSGPSGPGGAIEDDRPDPPPIDVVLFLIDTLRFDRLGAYGYAGARTPNLDALAAEAVVFEQAYSPGPWTLPSVASLQTSTFMCEHGVLVDGQQIPSAMTPLAERLRGAGYATASYFTNPFAGPMTGLDRGFDLHRQMHGTAAEDIRPWLDRTGDRSIYLYIHNVEPHNPYDAVAEDLDKFAYPIDDGMRTAVKAGFDYYRSLTRVDFKAGRTPGETDNTVLQRASLAFLDEIKAPVSVMYDATVAEADRRVGSVIDELKRRGRWDRTLFILVADHGEEFGEHGGWLHDQSVYEELVHVPMIVRLPGGTGGGTRVADVVSLVDVLPTVVSQIGRPDLSEGARGRDLTPLLTGGRLAGGDAADETKLFVPSMRTNRKKYFQPWKRSRGDQNVVVREGPYKGIWNAEVDRVELYDLAADPLERTDLAEDQPERAAAMRDFAARWLAECAAEAPEPDGDAGGPATLDEETRERLRSLGYI